MNKQLLQEKAAKIVLLLTDVDGVLTDNGVYYSADGEVLKRFSIRDGMGVERLRNCGIETGIITGENSGAVKKRAEKLNITELHLGIKDKGVVLKEILERKQLQPSQIAFIGDDVNDLSIITEVGFTACPVDAMQQVSIVVDYVCTNKGGYGAFRELAELIIAAKI
jgi:3-deoxy-D-manno-octulosonate 8-phosphate phosphatase (KDO 8-P phosphatase)